MLSVHYNYAALNVSRNLQQNTRANSDVMEKLASGFRINTGKDGPADLLISEQLRSQIEGLERAMQNANESNNILAITEGGLSQISNILKDMKKLAVASANTGVISPDQVAANQANMDASLQAIDRIIGTTNVGGRKLLENLQLEGKVPTIPDPANVVSTPETMTAEEKRSALLNGANFSGLTQAEPVVGDDGKLLSDREIILMRMGENGDEEVNLSFKEGDSLDDVMAQLQTYQDELAGYADATANGGNAEGELFQTANLGDRGTSSYIDSSTLRSMSAMSGEDARERLGNLLNAAPVLQISGAEVIDLESMSKDDRELYLLADSLSNFGMDSLGTVVFGDSTHSLSDLYSGGAASLSKDPLKAMEIIDKAMKDTLQQRSAIGATQKMNVHLHNAMSAELENATRLESTIRDMDMAEGMVEFTRTQTLMQVGTKLLQQSFRQNDYILDLLA